MGRGPGTSAARQYAGTMAGFWSRLASTLRSLEVLAADSSRLDEDAVDTLRVLQYRLHSSSEVLAGVEPPPGSRTEHEEVAAALVDARDATAEIVETIECGGPVSTQVLEWRGALFRLRLARMRLITRPLPDLDPPAAPRVLPAAAATALTFLGVGAFATGALLLLWPVWAIGLALVACGFLVYRP